MHILSCDQNSERSTAHRRAICFAGSGGEVFTNGDGIRTSKTVDGVKHTYLLSGSQIVGETWGNNLLIYLYDESGSKNYKKALKYIRKAYATGQIEDIAYGGISDFASWYTNNALW